MEHFVMPDDIKTPSTSLPELARLLAGIKVKNQLSSLSQSQAFSLPALASLAPPPKDLKSPLTKKWSPTFHSCVRSRLKKVTRQNAKRIKDITKGLTMPEISSVPIGSAKKMEAAILFFDLQDFTSISSQLLNESVLYLLNTIIPEMMQIVRHWKGEVEKNTGDGLMAIFGTETRNSFLIARDAIECAMTMKYIMLNDIQPKLTSDGLPSFNFRIGIDMGEVLISRIGVNNLNFLTVVGDAANRASKLQSLANPNGICIAENLHNNMAPILHTFCAEDTHDSWNWQYTQTKRPYRFYHYIFDWPDAREWQKVKL
jgi:class 3 adenylate cyclase